MLARHSSSGSNPPSAAENANTVAGHPPPGVWITPKALLHLVSSRSDRLARQSGSGCLKPLARPSALGKCPRKTQTISISAIGNSRNAPKRSTIWLPTQQESCPILSRGRTALGLRHASEAPKEQRSRRLTSSLRLRARPPGDPIKVQGKPPVASQTITSKGVPAVHLT